jgi:hypothetical protein
VNPPRKIAAVILMNITTPQTIPGRCDIHVTSGRSHFSWICDLTFAEMQSTSRADENNNYIHAVSGLQERIDHHHVEE